MMYPFKLVFTLFIALLSIQPTYADVADDLTDIVDTPSVNLNALPLYFEENLGQVDASARYIARAGGYSLFLTPDHIAFNLTLSETERYGLHMDFVGANSQPDMSGEALQQGITSYFKGGQADWITGAAHYGKVRYTELYDGIDAVFYGNPNEVQYDFLVSAGANPSDIRLSFDPVDSLTLTETGDLHLSLGEQMLTMRAPYTYQVIDGVQHDIASRFIVDGDTVGFEVGVYDTTHPLVIDPVFVYAGYIGGTAYEHPTSIDLDAMGNLYITGLIEAGVSPILVGPDLTFNGMDDDFDAFVAKVDPLGALVYFGYIGGSAYDSADEIEVDSSGNAYVIGVTESNQSTFPVTVGPDLTHNGTQVGDKDGYIAKVNPQGTGLVYAGYIGGDSLDYLRAIELDATETPYIAGYTASTESSLPVSGTLDLTHNGGTWDVFFGKVLADGSGLAYLGYLGGNGSDHITDARILNNHFYIVGNTSSTEATFPVQTGPDITFNGDSDGFISKISLDGTQNVYTGYIGGMGNDIVTELAVDMTGNAYVVGTAHSDETTFPVLLGPDLTHNGYSDGFIVKVNSTGTSLLFSGYIGGNAGDSISGIALDSRGYIYISGGTDSTDASIPLVDWPDMTSAGLSEGYVAVLHPVTAQILHAGYIGGDNMDYLTDLSLDTANNLYLLGFVRSTTGLPNAGGLDSTYGGNGDIFIAKVADLNLPSLLTNLLQNPSFETAGSAPKFAANWKGNAKLKSQDKRVCNTVEKPITSTEGNCVFQFSVGKPTDAARVVKQPFAQSPDWGFTGETLTLSADVQGLNVGTGSKKIILRVTYNNSTTDRAILIIPDGTYDYQTLTGSVTLTRRIKKAVVILNMGKSKGKLWIDNLVLTAAPASAPSPLPLPAAP